MEIILFIYLFIYLWFLEVMESYYLDGLGNRKVSI